MKSSSVVPSSVAGSSSGRRSFFTLGHGQLEVIASWQASEAERSRALPVPSAIQVATELGRRGAFADLVAMASVASGWRLEGPRGFDAESLISLLTSAFARRRLLMLDEGGRQAGGVLEANGEDEQRGTPDEKLIRRAMGSQPTLGFEGRRYLLVPASQRTQSLAVRGFRVLSPTEARAVLARMAANASVEKAALWNEVATNLAAGQAKTGVLLLRHQPPPTPVNRKSDTPVVTPSQLGFKPKTTDWIELKLLYEDDQPFEGRCQVTLPDGKTIDVTTDAEGLVRLEGIDPGTCKVTVIDVDASALVN